MNSLPQPTRLDDLLLRLYQKRRAAELWPDNLDADEADDLDVFRLAEEAIKALSSKLEAAAAELKAQSDAWHEQEDELQNLRSRLDSLSAAVRKAWDAHREGDMWKALGGAMDIVDPERNEQPIRAVERHSPND